MILTFKPQFVEAIKAGTKIHTIREDKKGRWRKNMRIHFWDGNPRNVSSNPRQFGIGICTQVNDIHIDFVKEAITITDHIAKKSTTILYFELLDEFARKDGFENWTYMMMWFYNTYPDINYIFRGKLIYFKLCAT